MMTRTSGSACRPPRAPSRRSARRMRGRLATIAVPPIVRDVLHRKQRARGPSRSMRAPPTPRKRTSPPTRPARAPPSGRRRAVAGLLAGDDEDRAAARRRCGSWPLPRFGSRPTMNRPLPSAVRSTAARSTIITRPGLDGDAGEARGRGGRDRRGPDRRHVDAQVLLRLGAFGEHAGPAASTAAASDSRSSPTRSSMPSVPSQPRARRRAPDGDGRLADVERADRRARPACPARIATARPCRRAWLRRSGPRRRPVRARSRGRRPP